MKSLCEYLEEFGSQGKAIGHFNISELAALKGIFEAARELALSSGVPIPVVIGVSEGEREFIGVRQAVALVKSLREEYDFPIFLNADHTHSLDKVKEAAEAGFDEILFDGSKLPFDENVAQTKQAVEIVKSISASRRIDILVEGEIGYIGSSSEIVAERPLESLTLTTPEEAKQFVEATGIDVLAPAVGNMHGLLKKMVTGEEHKRLDITRIAEIKKACGVLMTLHGGSGTADVDFVAAAKAGMNIIHVSTELRLAWRKGVEKSLHDMPNELAPYKILPPAVAGIKEVVTQRLRLFSQ